MAALVAGLQLAAGVLSSAAAQTSPSNPAAEQGVPGAPDQTAPHEGSATPAVVQAKEQSPPVNLSVLYTAELWRNAAGGIRTGGRYLDNLNVTLTVDAGRTLGWRGATFFIYGLYNNGQAFSGDLVGDEQTVSNIETGVRAGRLYEAWFEQRFLADRASIKFGLYDLNSEFDTTNVGSLSLLSSHGIGPEFAQSGRNGPSIFPYTSLAVRGAYDLGHGWTARAALLDGVPDDPQHPARTSVKLSRSDGALGVAEVAYVGKPASLTLGYWSYTAAFQPWSAIGPDTGGRGNQGAYAVVEAPLVPKHPGVADDKEGLAGFLQLGAADPRYNRIGRYVGGGLVYTGVIGAQDRIGVTLAHAQFSDGYRRFQGRDGVRVAPAETVVELTYRRALSPYLTLQPDLQYIVHPSLAATLPDAVAVGLRIELGG